MPATTNNDTILKAFNQAIQALLDLSIGGGSGCQDVTVNLPAPVVNIYNTVKCGGCGGGGSTPPQTPGEEGGDPPPGTGTPDPIDDRKCKVAHILIQELIAYTDNMASLGLFEFTLDYSSLGGILNSLASGFRSGLLSLIFQVGGWLQNLQNLIFSGGFGASIPETLSSNQDDMICALYNATNVSDAKNDVVAASGLTGQDAEYLKVVLTTEALNMLFFSMPGSEAVISSYQGAADCSGCGNVITYAYLQHGTCSDTPTETNRAIPVDGVWRTFQSEDLGYNGFAIYDNFIGDNTPVARWNVGMEFRNLTGYSQNHEAYGFTAGTSTATGGNDLYDGRNFTFSLSALNAVTTHGCGTVNGASLTPITIEARLFLIE